MELASLQFIGIISFVKVQKGFNAEGVTSGVTLTSIGIFWI